MSPEFENWPWLLTLGGEPGRVAAGSDPLAQTIFWEAVWLALGCVLMSGFWVRAALHPRTKIGGWLKWMNAVLFGFGGLIAFLIPALMTWWPIWSVLIGGRLLLGLVLYTAVGVLFFGKLQVHFEPTAVVVAKAQEVAAKAAKVAGYARRESDRDHLLRLAGELNDALGVGK